MARMELIIDELPLRLGGSVDPQALEAGRFRKVGVFRLLVTGQSAGRELFTLANCQMTCLRDDFSIFPCTHGYLDKDRQWETRASLIFKNGTLSEVLFQVIDGRYAASNFIERFADICSGVLGQPEEIEPDTARWVNGTAMVTTHLHRNRVHADFRFELIAS